MALIKFGRDLLVGVREIITGFRRHRARNSVMMSTRRMLDGIWMQKSEKNGYFSD